MNAENPVLDEHRPLRVFRGGGRYDFAEHIPTSYCDGFFPFLRYRNLGFRLVRNI
jgi:hypothetical protein